MKTLPLNQDYWHLFREFHIAPAVQTQARHDFTAGLACVLQLQDVPAGDAHSIAGCVFARMTNPRLKYHNPMHILSMVKFLSCQTPSTQPDLKEGWEFYLALFTHDVVYRPFQHDNEELSAELVRVLLEPWLDTSRVEDMILATAWHERWEQKDPATDLLMDLDLSHFVWDVEDVTDAMIKAEFMSVTDEASWIKGRASFLEKMLARDKLFRTPYFLKEHELTARDTLTKLVKKL